MKLILILFLIIFISNYDEINIYSNKMTESCIHETFSEKDHILIEYSIENLDEKKIINNNNFLVSIFNSLDEKIYNNDKLKGKFNQFFKNRDILSMCFKNKSKENVIIYYKILINIDLKDYSKLPNYGHYKESEQELNEIENIIKSIQSFIKFSKDLTNQNVKEFSNKEHFSKLILNFTFYLIFLIILIKLAEYYIIKMQVNQKKYN